jgi:hypothetical protein
MATKSLTALNQSHCRIAFLKIIRSAIDHPVAKVLVAGLEGYLER